MKIKTKIESYYLNLTNPELAIYPPVEDYSKGSSELYDSKMNNPSIPVMGYNVYSDDLEHLSFSRDKTIINTINAHSYVVARSDPHFRKALLASDVLIADGFPIVMAARILNKRKINKIAGEDMFFYLLKKLNTSKGRCFFLGSSEKTLNKINERLITEYPEVKTGFYSPPYKEKFSASDNEIMLNEINRFKPDVVFVGMTAPKQEKWVHENYESMEAGIICSIGAVFDFYARNIKRPSDFWIKLRLEWFIRLINEPSRLWRRYLISSPRFLKELLLIKLGIIKR